jgi:hypothetical protein
VECVVPNALFVESTRVLRGLPEKRIGTLERSDRDWDAWGIMRSTGA